MGTKKQVMGGYNCHCINIEKAYLKQALFFINIPKRRKKKTIDRRTFAMLKNNSTVHLF